MVYYIHKGNTRSYNKKERKTIKTKEKDKMLKVIKCTQTNEGMMLIKFEGGFTRLFKKETFLETVKKEAFYESNKEIINLGYACCTCKL